MCKVSQNQREVPGGPRTDIQMEYYNKSVVQLSGICMADHVALGVVLVPVLLPPPSTEEGHPSETPLKAIYL